MKFLNIFKVPKLPAAPVALMGKRVEVQKDAFIASLKPLDVGLTRGSGGLGWWENIFRVKEKEGPHLMTHAFLQYGPGTIAESNWPCVKSGKKTEAYLGGKRHTVFFRYTLLESWQLAGGISAIDTMVSARVPYAGMQILGFLPEFLGGKPAGNKSGVICSEFATSVLRGQKVPYVEGVPAHNVTPTDCMTWSMDDVALHCGWSCVAEAIGEKFYISG